MGYLERNGRTKRGFGGERSGLDVRKSRESHGRTFDGSVEKRGLHEIVVGGLHSSVHCEDGERIKHDLRILGDQFCDDGREQSELRFGRIGEEERKVPQPDRVADAQDVVGIEQGGLVFIQCAQNDLKEPVDRLEVPGLPHKHVHAARHAVLRRFRVMRCGPLLVVQIAQVLPSRDEVAIRMDRLPEERHRLLRFVFDESVVPLQSEHVGGLRSVQQIHRDAVEVGEHGGISHLQRDNDFGALGPATQHPRDVPRIHRDEL